MAQIQRDPGKEKNLNYARIRKNGKWFEIAINPDNAIAFKQGKNIPIEDCLIAEGVFQDAKNGVEYDKKSLMEAFGTYDVKEIAKKILKEGIIQTTTEYREKLREEKRRRIISIISANAIDPRTNLPHPPARIENAMKEAKVSIDEFKSADEQIDTIVHKLKPILPIKFELDIFDIRIPANLLHKCMPIIKQQRIKKEEKLPDGSINCQVEIPAGLKDEFIDKLNKSSHGGVTIKIIEKK